MKTLHAYLILESRRLFTLLTLMFHGEAYALRRYARELKQFESDVRMWLLNEAMKRLKALGPQHDIKQKNKAKRSSDLEKKTRERSINRSTGAPFRMPGTGPQRPNGHSSERDFTPRESTGNIREDKIIAYGRRLEAAQNAIDAPERILKRLMKVYANARENTEAARLVTGVFQRRAGDIQKRYAETDYAARWPSTDGEAKSDLPPPDT